MNWMNELTNVLQNYSQGAPAANDPAAVDEHFGQVVQAAPPADIAEGLSAMFRSDQTAPFAHMVGQLFSNSAGPQRANLLNTLLASGAGAGILAQLAKTAGLNLPGLGATPITPETAAQIPPEAVQQAAAQAEQHDPTIIDRVSEIYAQHPTLVRTLGTAALGIALSHFANRRR